MGLNHMNKTVLECIRTRDKNELYNLNAQHKLTTDDLVKAICEIDESITDWYKFKQYLKTKYNNFINSLRIP